VSVDKRVTMIADKWVGDENQRFQCCVCADPLAWQSNDYLLIRLTAPMSRNSSFQLLGAHAKCLNKVTSNSVHLP
jgi:hypothetical protein